MVNRVYIYNSYIVDCKIFERRKFGAKIPNPLSLKNLELKYTKGDISSTAAKKVRKVAEVYLTTIHTKCQIAHRLGVPKTRMPVFLTLTYPSVQAHSDKDCKRRHLGEFLKWLTRTKKCAGYIWRSEVQQNGNLHFHIFTDKYLYWGDVRAVWNSIVGKDNYIAEFAKVHGHTNPNSTDIEAVDDLAKAAAYLTKYITKAGKEVRLQEGRVWGMSDNVRKLKTYNEEGADRENLLQKIEHKIKEVRKIDDFVSVYILKDNSFKIFYLSNPYTKKCFEDFYIEAAKGLGM